MTRLELLVGGVMAAFMFVLGAAFGSHHVQVKWDRARLVDSEARLGAVATRIDQNAQTAAHQAAVNLDLKKESNHEGEVIAAERGRTAAAGLRIPATTCPGPARAAETASASGGVHIPAGAWPLFEVPPANPVRPESIELPADISVALTDKMEYADQIVRSCRVLQGFARGNGLAP